LTTYPRGFGYPPKKGIDGDIFFETGMFDLIFAALFFWYVGGKELD